MLVVGSARSLPIAPALPKQIAKAVQGWFAALSLADLYADTVMSMLSTLKDKKVKDTDIRECAPFQRLPSKRDYADYYKAIPFPIDIRGLEYNARSFTSVVQLLNDLNLMFENAKTYNAPGSPIFNAAKNLQRFCRQLVANRPISAAEPVESRERCQRILDAMMKATDEEGRVLSELFVKAPAKRLYPDYYQTIRLPMDLHTVQTRLNSGVYHVMRDMDVDVNLIFSNAKLYNEENSQVGFDIRFSSHTL